jgi:hypothetical protein
LGGHSTSSAVNLLRRQSDGLESQVVANNRGPVVMAYRLP